MKIQIASDLHLEMSSCKDGYSAAPIVPTGDILVLAGDILNTKSYDHLDDREIIEELSHHFKKVILIEGNHEHYRRNISNEDFSFLYDTGKIVFLNNNTFVYDDCRFICSTLWSGVEKAATKFINDYYTIPTMNKEKENDLHARSVDFLKSQLQMPFDGKTVVVTHHLPLQDCISEKYKNETIVNSAFASHHPELFEYDIDLWVHGHSHDFMQFEFNGVPVVRNPRGYDHEVGDFKQDFCVEI